MTGRHSQAGITVLGFLILATLVGIVGLGALKVTPMYIKNMRLQTVLNDLKTELDGKNSTPVYIRVEIEKRFSVEDINLPRDNIKITPSSTGNTVRITYENRAPYVADIYLVVVFDKQVEIKK